MKDFLSSLSQSMRLESTQKTRTKPHKGLFRPAFPFNLKSQTSIDAAMGWKEWTHAYADIVNLPSMHARYINKQTVVWKKTLIFCCFGIPGCRLLELLLGKTSPERTIGKVPILTEANYTNELFFITPIVQSLLSLQRNWYTHVRLSQIQLKIKEENIVMWKLLAVPGILFLR